MVPPPTPRTRAGLIAVRGFEQVERECPQLAEVWKGEGLTCESVFQSAYENTELHIVTAVAWKGLTGGEISDYERQVSAERGVVWAVGKTIDQAVFRGAPVVTKLCAKTFSKTLKQALAPAVKKVGIEPWKSKYWTHSTEHTLKGQTNKVYKRDDLIDVRRVDPKGRTNLQRMQRGLAPVSDDGLPINLHHSLQTMESPLVEITQAMHQKYSKIIHINPKSIPSGIDRKIFDAWKAKYWQQRLLEVTGK